jgi:hypothetical protein
VGGSGERQALPVAQLYGTAFAGERPGACFLGAGQLLVGRLEHGFGFECHIESISLFPFPVFRGSGKRELYFYLGGGHVLEEYGYGQESQMTHSISILFTHRRTVQALMCLPFQLLYFPISVLHNSWEIAGPQSQPKLGP